MKVQVNQNTRGFETMEKGEKLEGKISFVKLTDNQKRVYETKSYTTETIKKYFRNGEYRIFVRNMKTGETNKEGCIMEDILLLQGEEFLQWFGRLMLKILISLSI